MTFSTMNQFFVRPLLAAALALAATSGHAHINLAVPSAAAGSSYKAVFKVGHGCDASPTRQISVEIPAGVTGAHPMPKPGWRLQVERNGAEASRITWTARSAEDALPDAQYDEFVLVARLPAQAGALYWPVRQLCNEGGTDWTEVPPAGQSAAGLKSPAARLEVVPASGHQHMH